MNFRSIIFNLNEIKICLISLGKGKFTEFYSVKLEKFTTLIKIKFSIFIFL